MPLDLFPFNSDASTNPASAPAKSDAPAAVDAAPVVTAQAEPKAQPKADSKADAALDLFPFNVDPVKTPTSGSALFKALIGQESGGKQFAKDGTPLTSNKGAIGIAQVMPATAPEAAKLAGLPFDDMKYRTDPEYNATIGAAYFDKQMADFGDTAKALAAYNGGPTALRRALRSAEEAGSPGQWLRYMPVETQKYVPAILASFQRSGGQLPAAGAPGAPATTTPATRRDTFTNVTPKGPGATWTDIGKEVGASAVQGIGSIGQFVGEGAAAVANKVSGTEDFEGKNVLKPAAEGIRNSMTQGGKDARADAAFQGDALDVLLGDWSQVRTPDTLDGWLMTAANGFGSVLSSLVPVVGQARKVANLGRAAEAATAAGDLVKAAELTAAARAASTANKVLGAGSGGAMTGGAAAEDVRESAAKTVGAMTHDQLLSGVPVYAQVFQATGDQEQARSAVVNSAARWAAGLSAVAGAAGGAFNAKIIEDFLVHKGVAAAVGNSAGSRVARGAIAGAGGAVAEGFQEGTEKVGQNAGENVGLGRPLTDNVTRDTFGDVVGGALVGGGLGGVGGIASHGTPHVDPALAPVTAKAAEPNSPLSRAAVASNTPELQAMRQADQAKQAQAEAGEVGAPGNDGGTAAAPKKTGADRLAELEAIGKGTPAAGEQPEQPGRFFTHEEKAEYDSLVAARDATPGQKPVEADAIGDRAKEIGEALRAPGVLDAFRSKDAITPASTLLKDLATAQSPSSPKSVREQALGRIEYALSWAGVDLTQRPAPAEAAPQTDPVLAALANPAVSDADKQALLTAYNTALNAKLPEATREQAKAAAREIAGRYAAPTSNSPGFEGIKTAAVQSAPVTPLAQAERLEAGAHQFEVEGYPQEAQDLRDQADSRREQAATDRAEQVARERELAPKPIVEPTSTPAGTGPAYLRRRSVALRQLVDLGFSDVQRTEDGFVLRNPANGKSFKLEGAADAQLARKAVLDAIRDGADMADQSASLAKKKARVAKLGRVAHYGGLPLAIENQIGSTRSGTDPTGKEWSVTMSSDYGDIVGTKAADGDFLDVYLAKDPRPNAPVYVVDQYNEDGSFDETKSVLGATSREAAIRIYDAHFSDGSGPRRRRAVTEMSPEDFKTWAFGKDSTKPAGETNGATGQADDTQPGGGDQRRNPDAGTGVAPGSQPDVSATADARVDATESGARGGQPDGRDGAPGASTTGANEPALTIKVNGQPITLGLVNALPEAESLARGGKAVTISNARARRLNEIAAAFGKEIQFFSDPAHAVGDGFIMPERPSTVFLNEATGISPIAVLGHELMHLLKLDNPKAHAALEAVVAERLKKGAREQQAKLGYSENQVLEEITSDLGGDFLSDAGFWGDVFDKIRADNGTEATSIIARLADFFYRTVESLGVNLRKFGATEMVDDVATIRAAFRDAIADYLQASGTTKATLQAETMRAGQAAKRSVDRAPTVGMHFSKQPRETLDGRKHGSGLKGAEASRLAVATDPRITQRVYAYTDGRTPEAGVGGYAHEVALGNLYDVNADPQGLWGPDFNAAESRILDAGYDGYFSHGVAVIMGEASHAVPAKALNGTPAEQLLRRGLMSKEIEQILPRNIPGAQLRSGTLVFPAASLDKANAEMARIGSDIRFSKDRLPTAKSEYEALEKKLKGTEGWMKAPNGEATQLSERQWVHVRTPSFKKWFGDWEQAHANGGVWGTEDVSKAVHANGEPLVVYHGTDKAGFSVFQRNGGAKRGDLGIFATPDRSMAASYVRKGRPTSVNDEDIDEDSADKSGIYGLFMNVRSPNEEYFEGANWDGTRNHQWIVEVGGDQQFDEDGKGYFTEDEARERAESFVSPEDRESGDVDASYYMRPANDFFRDTDSVVREGRALGSDGAILRDVIDHGSDYHNAGEPGDVFVAFEPGQVKSADFNAGEYSATDDDIRRSRERQIPESIDAVTSVDSGFEFAATRQFGTNREFKLALQGRALEAAKAARVQLGQRSDAAQNYLVRVGVLDALSGLRSNSNAVGWYNEKVTKALRIVSLIHPELQTDPYSRFAFTWALAVTSNGIKVDKNFELAEQAYSTYKQTGRMPTNIKAGTTQKQINKSLKLFNDLRDAWGIDELIRFATTKVKVKEAIKATGVKITGEGANTEVYGAAILGPKIGNGFFANLYGHFDQLTMDRWLMRTWGRWTGTLVENDKANIKLKREQMDGLLRMISPADRKAFENVIGTKLRLGDLDGTATTIKDASAKPALRDRMNAIAPLSEAQLTQLDEVLGKAKEDQDRHSLGGELRKLGNGLWKYLDGQKEAPAGSKERDFIRQVFSGILRAMQVDRPELTMSDLQALVWYPEKRLYDAAKAAEEEQADEGYDEGDAPDYANAAEKLAEKKGVPREKIDSTVKEVDHELETAKRAGAARRGSAGQQQADRQAGAGEPSASASAVRDGRGPRGSGESLALDSRPEQSDRGTSLAGLPAEIKVDGELIRFGGFKPAQDAARAYATKAGLAYAPPAVYAKVDPERATRIAKAFEDMKHAPEDPEVKAAYRAMIDETAAQYQAMLDTGLVVEFIEGDDPYGNPRNAILDVTRNNHLWVYPTTEGFGGSESADIDISGNPLLEPTKFKISGKTALANDLFRAVHDYFGHVAEGVGFRADGEENAWRKHAAMYSPLARRAATTETRAQNSWVNYGPFAEFNATAKGDTTQYAPQKIGLLPEWVSDEGRTDAKLSRARPDRLQEFKATDKDGTEFDIKVSRMLLGANRDQDSVMVEARTADGNRRGLVSFNLSDGNQLAAENAIVAPPYRRKGLASEMYKAAAKAGYDVIPGRRQTEDGAAMVEALQRNGVIGAGEITRSVDRTDTPEFKRWFGDSKVVDAEGKPLVVYHGTGRDFSVFDPHTPGGSTGFFFTESPTYAALYAPTRSNGWRSRDQLHGNIMPVYLQALNPKRMTGDEWKSIEHGGYPSSAVLRVFDQGFDSIHIASFHDTTGKDVWIVQRPSQIKSATGNTGAFDPGSADITRSAERPLFFSQLEVAIGDVPDRLATMSAPQWKLWLDANAGKLGVKKDEVEWSGIKDYLTLRGKDKVSRDELAAYMRDNGVKVSETQLGRAPTDPVRAAADRLADDGMRWVEDENGVFLVDQDGDSIDDDTLTPQQASDLITLRKAAKSSGGEFVATEMGPAKYETYTVPGGENYREVLITLPGKPNMRKQWALLDTKGDTISVRAEPPNQRWHDDVANQGYKIEEREVADKQANERGNQYTSSHWDQPNIVAHLRVDARTDANGARVMFVNEIQSDWGQDGKKKGFKGDGKISAEQERAINEYYEELSKQKPQIFGDAKTTGTRIAQMGMLESNAAMERAGLPPIPASANDYANSGMVPRAPFVTDTKSWVALAMKRALVEAVRNGYDKVAFINGQQAADLYDLSKHIDRVDYNDNGDGTYGVSAIKDGREIFSKDSVLEAELEDIVGKEVATKIVAGEGESDVGKVDRWEPDNSSIYNTDEDEDVEPEVRSLSGLDLKVGGEGMRAFYDQIIPQVARDVLKKVGGGQLKSVRMTPYAGKYSVDEGPGEPVVHFDTRDEAVAHALAIGEGEDFVIDNSKNQIQLGFDITPEMRAKLDNGAPMFSKDRLNDIKLAAGYTLGDLMKTSKKVSWWDKTVGTPFHMAEKNPEFKRTYDAVQNFISDISRFATRSADLAPTILPKLENMKDIAKRPLSLKDTEALSDPVFLGTLSYMRDAEGNAVRTDDVGRAGVVWRDEELRQMFKLDDSQIALYREFRKSVNKSLNDLGITDMIRYAGKDADAVRADMLASSTAKHAGEILANHLGAMAEEDTARANTLQNTAEAIKEKANMVAGLIAKGYAPLSRFGDFTVYVTKDDGKEQVYFGMFETEREANKMARAMKVEHPDAKVETGTMSKESYKLFKGVTPETLALFGESLGLEEGSTSQQSQVFQAYLQAAKTNRSAMKRMIERKGVNGYSEDVGRVLAGFAYSNARQASTNLHAGEISKSAAAITDGDVKDHAINLVDYVQSPRDEANALRGLLFANFIGGSVASALVNTTQSLTTTWPVLTQHFGVGKAGKALLDAARIATRGAGSDTDLAAAMKRAEQNGVTAPQETHDLQAQAAGRGSLTSGDGTRLGDALAKVGNAKSKTMMIWGKMFSYAEQLNRRIAFAAAYKLARDRGDKNAYEFAVKTVAETQFVMNKGANPVWARGPVGATLFTFKKFSVFYLEGLARMWGSGPEGKKAFALSLAVMFVLAGMGGFPFADDLDDVIDGFAQRVLNKSFSSKAAKKEFFTNLLGKTAAEFIESGVSGLPGAPIDVSGRLGMGNVVPGTGLFTKKQDHSRDVTEVGGAAASFLGNLFTSAGMVAQGNVRGAAANAAPTALANVVKALEMADRGAYVDYKGRKVIDTTPTEAVLKGIGFQPASVKSIQEATSIQQSLIGLNKIRETEIADLWAKGRIDRKPELVEDAKRQVREWNEANPYSKITIDPGQISKRVQQANMSKAARIEKTAPKEIRKTVKAELERVTSE